MHEPVDQVDGDARVVKQLAFSPEIAQAGNGNPHARSEEEPEQSINSKQRDGLPVGQP
jgi:hypothetical protein